MDKEKITLTVYFENPFWVGLFEKISEGKLSVSKVNPKRMQRIARKQTLEKGIGTKSQQALQLQREEGKQKRKEFSREKKEAEKQRMFELKQQKRKEKHRGR